MADDRVIRAFYDFLLVRDIKPTYHGKDIPVGAYQRALKDSRRSDTEQFMEWLVENEDMGVKWLHLTNKAFADRYKVFKGEGAHDRSTDVIMKQLSLQGVVGVVSERKRPQNLEWCINPSRLPWCPIAVFVLCCWCPSVRQQSHAAIDAGLRRVACTVFDHRGAVVALCIARQATGDGRLRCPGECFLPRTRGCGGRHRRKHGCTKCNGAQCPCGRGCVSRLGSTTRLADNGGSWPDSTPAAGPDSCQHRCRELCWHCSK